MIFSIEDSHHGPSDAMHNPHQPLKVEVCSNLRLLKPKCTIESRAIKRSSIHLIRTLLQYICFSYTMKTSNILRVLRIILVILPEHQSDTLVFTMTMEILPEPTSNKLYGRSDTYAGNPVREILLNLNLPDHGSVLIELEVHVKMEMKIPHSSKVKFITACLYSIDEYNDMMKA
ncbi:hypothetical protein Tco_0542935 [Tanacetum coccineum]